MAASTITRVVWTDGAAGTVVNNARKNSDIYDKVDEMFAGAGSYATFTLGGKFAVEGFGTHTVTAGGTGGNILRVRNTTAGTGNYARLELGNDSTTPAAELRLTSSTYTTLAPIFQNALYVACTQVGGISIDASHASGVIRFYTGSSERLRLSASGNAMFGGTAISGTERKVMIAGACETTTVTDAGTKTATLLMSSTSGSTADGGIIEFGAGYGSFTQPYFAAIRGALTSSTSNTTGDLVVLTRATTGATGLTEVCRFSTAGAQFADGAVATPSVAFKSNTDTGFYYEVSGGQNFISASIDGVNVFDLSKLSAGEPFCGVPGGAFGTGGIGGSVLTVGNNTSGGGAAGIIAWYDKAGVIYPTWVDGSGNLRIATGLVNAPDEDGTPSDTSGTVVGTQASRRVTKRLIRRFRDTRGALQTIVQTPLYRFRYKSRAFNDTEFLGIIAEESPLFAMDDGRSFNPISAFGYSVAAVQELARRVAQLEART